MTTERRSRRYRRLWLPFWNRREHRLRAFWRVLAAVAVVVLVSTSFNLAVVRPLDVPLAVAHLVSNGVAAIVALGVLVGWARYVDRRPLRSYGFGFDRRWWLMAALGAVIAIVGWGGALATDVALGWASVAAVVSPGSGELPFVPAVGLFALGWLSVGVWEEVVFRGIVMRNAIEGLDVESVSFRTAVVGGWLVSSALFGILHFDQATSLLALGFWILAGLVLGLAYLLTDQLAVPIGLHFGFDFAVNNVFGLASVRDAGTEAPTLIRPAFTGPDLFVGVSGVVNTAWLVVIGVLTVAAIAWQSGGVRPRIRPYSRRER